MKMMQESIKEICLKEAEVDYCASIGDFNYLATRLGDVPTLMIGPGGDKLHQSDEYAYVDSIISTAKIVESFMEKLLLSEHN